MTHRRPNAFRGPTEEPAGRREDFDAAADLWAQYRITRSVRRVILRALAVVAVLGLLFAVIGRIGGTNVMILIAIAMLVVLAMNELLHLWVRRQLPARGER